MITLIIYYCFSTIFIISLAFNRESHKKNFFWNIVGSLLLGWVFLPISLGIALAYYLDEKTDNAN